MLKHKTPLEAFNNAFGVGVAEWLRDVAESTLSDDDLAILGNRNSTKEQQLAVGYTVRRNYLSNGRIRITACLKRESNVTAQPMTEYLILAIGDFSVQSDLSWKLEKELRGKEIGDVKEEE